MRLEIELDPATNNKPKAGASVKLFPENNKEMAELEWIRDCQMIVEYPERGLRKSSAQGGRQLFYVIGLTTEGREYRGDRES